MAFSNSGISPFHILRVVFRPAQPIYRSLHQSSWTRNSSANITLSAHVSKGSTASSLIVRHKSMSQCFARANSSSAFDDQNFNSTKILYDGECKLCALEISGLKRVARNRHSVEFIDITSPSYDPSKFSGVTYEDAMKEMHVIDSNGQVHVQGDAIRHMYRACGLGWLASVTELPGVKPLCDKLYIKFAEYRLNKALERCESEGDRCTVKLHHLREKLKKSESG